jgi:hypothetical protein
MFKQEVLLGGGGPTLTFNKSGEEGDEEEGLTADRFYKGVRQVPGTYCPVDPMTFRVRIRIRGFVSLTNGSGYFRP